MVLMNARAIDSVALGRPPADDPLTIQLSFRVNESTGNAIDDEIKAEARPGLRLSRNDMARMLLAESIEARSNARRAKRSK